MHETIISISLEKLILKRMQEKWHNMDGDTGYSHCDNMLAMKQQI